jgi:hypothetical protein
MAELIKINAGFATVGQGAGPMMVTWKAGLFRKHGLDVARPPVMGGAKGVVRGLMSGEIQFGNLAAPAPLRANLKGEADVVFLTGGINQQFLVGRPGINSREELSGKKIGTVNDGGIGDALVKFVIAKLDSVGIKGLQEVTIGHGAVAEMDALLSGKVDVVVGTPPECIDAIRHGCKYLIDFANTALTTRWAASPRGVITSRKTPISLGNLSKPISRVCTVIAPTESLPSTFRPITAASPTVASPKKPTTSLSRACRGRPTPSLLHYKRCSTLWPEIYPRPEARMRGTLLTIDLSASWRRTVLSSH